MPTLKEYKNKKGHYINAWVSEGGNVTYQVEPEASTILTKIGYQDQDELPWVVIRALRVVGVVGIGGNENRSGIGSDDFEPEAELDDVSSDIAERLYSELEQLSRINADDLNQANSLLGIETSKDPSQSKFERRKESLESTLSGQLAKMARDDDYTSIIFSEKQQHVLEFTAHDHTDIAHGGYKIKGGFEVDDGGFGIIMISVWGDDDNGIAQIEAQIAPWGQQSDNSSFDWEMRAQVHTAIGEILPALQTSLQNSGFKSGSARDNVEININPI